MKKLILIILMFSAISFGLDITSGVESITIHGNESGSGASNLYIVVKLNEMPSGISEFKLYKSDEEFFKEFVSLLLTAQTTEKNVKIWYTASSKIAAIQLL